MWQPVVLGCIDTYQTASRSTCQSQSSPNDANCELEYNLSRRPIIQSRLVCRTSALGKYKNNYSHRCAVSSIFTCVSRSSSPRPAEICFNEQLNMNLTMYEYTEYVLLMIKTGADKMMPDFYKHTYHFNMIHGERLLMHHWVRRWGESMEEGHIVSAALWWLDWMCSSHRWRPCIHWQLPQISKVFPAFRLLMKESPLCSSCVFH